MEVPIRSGSLYFNCKDRRGTVLMGNSDIHYIIILVSTGKSGRSGDGGIFAKSNFEIAFESKILNLHKSSFLPNTKIEFSLLSFWR